MVIIAAAFAVPAAAQDASGIYGVVRSQSPDGSFGAAIEKALVSALDEAGTVVARSYSTENGAYRLTVPSGNYRLVAEHHAYKRFDTERPVLLVQEQHFTLFNVGLEPVGPGLASIRGKVEAEDGGAIAGATVNIYDNSGDGVAQVECDADGRFFIEVTPGNYRLAAGHGDRSSGAPLSVSVGESEEVEVSITINPKVGKPGVLQGLVRARAEGGATGKPIPGVVVTASNEDGTVGLSATTNEIGFYKMSLPPGRYRAGASHPDYQATGSGQQPLVVVSDAVQTWNALMQPKDITGVVQTCRRQFKVGVGSSYGERHIIYLRINRPGPLNVTYRWEGDASRLALIVRRPDGVPLRIDGKSPLQLSAGVTTELIALASQWEFIVANFGGGRADGSLTVNYPCER